MISGAHYISIPDVARRWGYKVPRTARRIIKRFHPTAIMRVSPRDERVPWKVVLDIERKLRGCGEIDL